MTKTWRSALAGVAVGAFTVLTLSCGGAAPESADAGSRSGADALAASKADMPTPPQEYYDAVFKREINRLAMAATEHALWVNFNGATVTKGYAPTQSFLLCTATATIPSSGFAAAEQTAIVAKVQAFFDAQRVALKVTATRPTSMEYTTIHVGGSYASLGCDGTGLAGIAPFDDKNVNDADVGFVFTASDPSADLAAVLIAHEAGHSYGLDHSGNVKDIMYATVAADAEGFISGTIPGTQTTQDGGAVLRANLGEVNPNPTPTPIPVPNIPDTVPGADILNTIAQLIAVIDSGNTNDIIKVIETQIGTLFPQAAVVMPGIDKIITIITAMASGNGQINPADITQLVGSIVDVINKLPLNGPVVTKLQQLLKNVDIVAIMTSVEELIKMIDSLDPTAASHALAFTSGNAKADLSTLLGIDNVTKASDLLATMKAHKKTISAAYQGATKDTLMTLVKGAYIQAYGRCTE